MECPDGVIVPLGGRVKVPAVPGVVGFQLGQVGFQHGLVGFPPHRQEARVHHDPEKLPVVPRHVIAVDLVQPAVQVVPGAFGQLVEKASGRQGHAQAIGGHLHHALVKGADVAPVFLVGRVHAMDDALPPLGPEGLGLRHTPGQQGNDAEQHPGEALHAGNAFVIVGAGGGEHQAGLAGGEILHRGTDDGEGRVDYILPGAKGIMLQLIHVLSSVG